jgi:uncharacterized damage-inducible protein DinB
MYSVTAYTLLTIGAMNTSKWFDRQFDFNLSNDEYALVYKRLQHSIDKLQQIVPGLSNDVLIYKPQGKWSIKEHTGHLSVLEPLWRERVVQIQQGKPVLTPADLENKATFEAGFNDWHITILLEKFTTERNQTLLLLDSIKEEDKIKTSLHPRLKQPMRIIDLAYFVAEHDEHHLKAIEEISGLFNK